MLAFTNPVVRDVPTCVTASSPMNLLLRSLRLRRAPDGASGAPDRVARPAGDDTLGRGMDVALTVLVFLLLGWLIDEWLGVFPAFTIGLVVFAAVGTFIRMKYVYDATMERLEAERAQGRRTPARLEDVA